MGRDNGANQGIPSEIAKQIESRTSLRENSHLKSYYVLRAVTLRC